MLRCTPQHLCFNRAIAISVNLFLIQLSQLFDRADEIYSLNRGKFKFELVDCVRYNVGFFKSGFVISRGSVTYIFTVAFAG